MEHDQLEFPTPSSPQPSSIDINGSAQWNIEALGGASGKFEVHDSSLTEGGSAAHLVVGGYGDVTFKASSPIAIADNSHSLQMWVQVPKAIDPDQAPELVLLFDDDKECSIGSLDFAGWHLLTQLLSPLDVRELRGVSVRGLVLSEETQIVLDALHIDSEPWPAAIPLDPPPAVFPSPLSMFPITTEEFATSVEQDDISFVFESRSLSAVLRFVYTPIEGNLSDIELEINNGDPIRPAADGGITIDMGGKIWSAADEEIERHFVSCEQVGEFVEARWQWKHGDELADFLYRIRIEGKSLIVEVEGGNGRASGVSLGHVEDALTPKLIDVPYFNLGDDDVRILSTAGLFLSTYVDWFHSNASTLYGSPEGAAEATLNGGCTYLPRSDGKRHPLSERIIITGSRQFEEVLPTMHGPSETLDQTLLAPLVWHRLAPLADEEEAYVEAYESLLSLKEMGMDELLVLHPAGTWNDGGGTISTVAAKKKGGEDALSEYLDALGDLGYKFTLHANFGAISPLDEQWDAANVALLPDGNMAPAGRGSYRLRAATARSLATGLASNIRDKHGSAAIQVGEIASTPPWQRLDCDSRLPQAARFLATLEEEQALLSAASHEGITVVDGGSQWMYTGLCHGYTATLAGKAPCRRPLLVDFALRFLHPYSIGAGVGSIEEFYGGDIPAEEKNASSNFLTRYLAATVVYGHAALLPEPEVWGMAATVKTYYMLQQLQSQCVASPVAQIRYHHDGNFLETTEALMSDAHLLSQIQIDYENGVQINVNGGWEEDWTIEHGGETYRLPAGGFWAHGPDDLMVYSADAGEGYIDFAQCSDYVFIDTRGQQLSTGPISLSGAALVREANWKIDLLPVGPCSEIQIEPAYFWPDRRLPRLRLLAFHTGDDEPETLKSEITDKVISFTPDDTIYKYRIALPEWMVEPGK